MKEWKGYKRYTVELAGTNFDRTESETTLLKTAITPRGMATDWVPVVLIAPAAK